MKERVLHSAKIGHLRIEIVYKREDGENKWGDDGATYKISCLDVDTQKRWWLADCETWREARNIFCAVRKTIRFQRVFMEN